MKLEDIIRTKGTDVVTISSDASVIELVSLLAEHRIGAAVVSNDGRHVDGIVSERDIVRVLGSRGTDLLELTVADLMTADVHTCHPEDKIEDLARAMTDRRIRHVPVVVKGELHAIVSIGDVVKHRIDQLTEERDQLIDYLHT